MGYEKPATRRSFLVARCGPDLLPALLSPHSNLPIRQAIAGDRLRPAIVYIAPPGRHVIISADRTLTLTDTAKTNFTRPSIDVLFHSAELVCGRAIDVILAGSGQTAPKARRQ
jgi:two-component system chemotaxis response regulator CheB